MWTLPCLSRYIKWNLEGECCCGDSSLKHQYISFLRPAQLQAPATKQLKHLQQRPKWLKTCLCFTIRNSCSGNWYCNSFQKCRYTHRHTQTQTHTDTQILAQIQTQTQTHRYKHRYLHAHTHKLTHSLWLASLISWPALPISSEGRYNIVICNQG